MQRVVVLFVGLLSVVRATPFDPDSVEFPTLLQYNFRVKEGEFGNYAFPENSKHEDEIVTFKSSKNSKRMFPSDGGKLKGLHSLFGNLKDCDIISLKKTPKEGCIYVANGNVYFMDVLFEVDIDVVYIAFQEAGIKKCKVGEDGFDDVPEESCFRINEAKKSVYWIGVYDENGFYRSDKVDDIKGLFGNVEKCDLTGSRLPKGGCSLFDEDGIHYVSVLHRDNIDDVVRSLNELNIPECVYDNEVGVIINDEPCYLFNPFLNILHFMNLQLKPKVVQDDDNDDDHYSEETYKIPDVEVSTPFLVQPATGSGDLPQLTLKGLINQRLVDAKKAKAVLPKNIQSIQELQEIKKRFGRQGRQHGNHRPQWMN